MEEIKFKPAADRILIQPSKQQEKTAGGIIIPPSVTTNKPQHGVIMSIGPSVKEAKLGDHVLYGAGYGTEISYNDNVYVVIRENDIIGTVK